MRCDDVLLNLPDYILGKIEPNLKKSVEYHLDACPKCKAELDEMSGPIRLLGEVEVEEYPDSFWQELQATIMERVSRPSPSRQRVPAYAGALAALLLIIGVGVFEFAHRSAVVPQNVAALTASISPQQAAALPGMNINYVNAISSQASELDEMDAVDDSLQQAVVNALWSSVSDSSGALDAVYYGNNFSN